LENIIIVYIITIVLINNSTHKLKIKFWIYRLSFRLTIQKSRRVERYRALIINHKYISHKDYIYFTSLDVDPLAISTKPFKKKYEDHMYKRYNKIS